MTAMMAAEAMSRAAALAGSDQFGAAGFEDGLERALAAFPRLPLKPEVMAAEMDRIVQDLANRLRIEQWYAAHPSLAAEKIEGPLLVCGLPRTGTTATVGMLALDPRFRFPRMWEMSQPVPPPRLADEANDPRAVAYREAMQAHSHASQHIADPDGPEEDMVGIAPLDMHAYHGAYPMPDDFIAWWIDADFASTYAYHRRVLTLLQSQRPPHLWLLKGPVHLFHLDAFAAEYPQAKFVWTHRDPASVIPSVASLQYTLHAQRCVEGALDKAAAGPKALGFWAEGMRRALAARERIGDERFIDVWNRDVVARPVETFAGLYYRLGYDFTPDLEADIADY
ncbi:MAG: sulfotransferase, partial [Sphingomonadales bacterium]|nr:sulfotransferase [Sphingomonadales bacterium]